MASASRSSARAPTRTRSSSWGFSIHAALSARRPRVPQPRSRDRHRERGRSARGDRRALPRRGLHPGRSGPAALDARASSSACSRTSDDGWRVLPAPPASRCPPTCSPCSAARSATSSRRRPGSTSSRRALVASRPARAARSIATQRIAVAACIEQTIPFRVDPVTELHDRLVGARPRRRRARRHDARARSASATATSRTSPTTMPARFLDNTWKLLPESNPALHSPLVYTVRDYRIALQKMEGFLAWLPAERVFHTWGDEPKPRDPRAPRRAHDRQPRARGALPAREAVLDRARRGDRRGRPAATCRSTTSWAASRPRPAAGHEAHRAVPAAARRRRPISIRRCIACSPRAARRSRASTPGRRRSARSCTRRSARPR